MLHVYICGASRAETTHLQVELLQALADQRLAASASVETADPELGNVLNAAPNLPQLVLLLGLEGGDGLAQDADQTIRGKLGSAGQPFEVLYGSTQERQTQALALIDRHSPGWLRLPGNQVTPVANSSKSTKSRPWVWLCDKCSDPVCEHRLLRDLLTARLA
jgi:hypothetical protein